MGMLWLVPTVVLVTEEGSSMSTLWLALALVLVIFVTLISFLNRYKRCSSDQVMVIYGKVGKGSDGRRSARCIHGGAAFIWPVIQDYQFLSLIPITIEIDLQGALSKENIRINAPSTFTVGISTDAGIMENAAERLLGLSVKETRQIAEEIIFGQTRVAIATMAIQDIIANRDKLVEHIMNGVEVELRKIGLRLINVNIKDITDDSGYIDALGKEAAARAINAAKKAVAEQNRNGEIGKAEAEREQRIQVAAANATAVDGENTAQVNIANSNAHRREKEADASRRGTAAEKVQGAKALEEAYKAEGLAELQRAERERSTQLANIIVPTEVNKQKIEIDADAAAERYRRMARGEADGMYAKLEAQARGNRETLVKQAEGLQAIVNAAGGSPNMAALLMITQKLPEMVNLQVEAIKNLKIDKVTVWDSVGSGGDGVPTTAKFVAGLLKSLPPLQNMFEMAGLKLPELLAMESHADKEKAKQLASKAQPAKEKEEKT